MASRGTPSANGEGRPNRKKDSGRGCCGSRNTGAVVGDTSQEYPGLGTGG